MTELWHSYGHAWFDGIGHQEAPTWRRLVNDNGQPALCAAECCGHADHSPEPGRGCLTRGCLCLEPVPLQRPVIQSWRQPSLPNPGRAVRR